MLSPIVMMVTGLSKYNNIIHIYTIYMLFMFPHSHALVPSFFYTVFLLASSICLHAKYYTLLIHLLVESLLSSSWITLWSFRESFHVKLFPHKVQMASSTWTWFFTSRLLLALVFLDCWDISFTISSSFIIVALRLSILHFSISDMIAATIFDYSDFYISMITFYMILPLIAVTKFHSTFYTLMDYKRNFNLSTLSVCHMIQ